MPKVILLTVLSLVFLLGGAGTVYAVHPGNPSDVVNCLACHAFQGTGTVDYSKYANHPPVQPTDNCGACHGIKDMSVPGSYTSPSPPVIRYDSPTQPTVHRNYSSNTDACASCHSTHTAVGARVLKWLSSTATCMACHDGTIAATYNVKNGKIGNAGARTSGGLFGAGTETGLSVHNVTTNLTTSAAPGGAEKQVVDANGVWNTSFNCSACHASHGQGSNSRILHPDPNGVALRNKVTGEILSPAVPGTVYSSVKPNWIKGYPYSQYTNFYVNGSRVTTGFTINYRTGIVTFSPAIATSAEVKADYVPGIQVVMSITGKLTAQESVSYISGINEFCGACHTDYNTSAAGSESGHKLTGSYRKAYRHGVGMTWDDSVRGTNIVDTGKLKLENVTSKTGKVTCLTCHYAHGTDDEFAGGTTSDTRSTALKRQVNMGICESCHQKGAASNY